MEQLLSKNSKIYVAGHRGLVGSALVRQLKNSGYTNILGKTHAELDLLDPVAVKQFFAQEKPDVVILAAALVGGIHANNTYRSEFIFNNLQIQNNVVWTAHENDVKKLVFLGSSCIYPRQAPQPMRESHLLTGPLEYTNRPYALAKIAGVELVSAIRLQYKRNWFSVMPTNLYGPGDNFHPENSHVLPALIRRFVEAKETKASSVTIWGTGSPLREFMHVDDCASAIAYLMERVDSEFFANSGLAADGWCHINVGSGQEVSISELAKTISNAVGFQGALNFDASKPDGTLRKLMDNSILRKSGWSPSVDLEAGIKQTVRWYLENIKNIRQ